MRSNIQEPEKRFYREDGKLQVNSIFYTIQGEGPFTGFPAVFIRLAGCNLQCPQCDTEYTDRTLLSVPEILSNVKSNYNGQSKDKLIVVTGGEPFRQDISELCKELCKAGFFVQIETNGTLNVPPALVGWLSVDVPQRDGVYIICSPKAGKVNESLFPHICAYKYVMSHNDVGEDGLPNHALEHSANPRLARPHKGYSGPVYLQPCDEKNHYPNKLNQDVVVESCLKFGYILQLQVHKLIGVQ